MDMYLKTNGWEASKKKKKHKNKADVKQVKKKHEMNAN